ncbi:GDSL-type esterase/lipase family protein [Bacillus cereus group sp. RP43]|uniref:SGNH/GDSL hydrolase family protein n=1 Tax=Bacillus cereus group sp. RP43 TaxID=3040260 RepID=UPI003392AAE0
MNFKKVATISIVLNAAFFLVGGYFVYSNEGISYIKDKVPFFTSDDREVETPSETKVKGTEVSLSTSDNNDKKITFTPLHKVRESVFNSAESVGTGVVFLGDSLTDYNEWGEVFPHVKTYNRGISGDTTIDVMYRLNQVMSLKPSKVFLMVGINDLRAKTPKEEVVDNYKNIVKQLKTDLPDTKVFIESILPVRVSKPSNLKNEDVNWINKELEKIAKENEYKFIDLHPLFTDNDGQLKEAWTVDGVHINSTGYKAWENEIKNDVYR